MCTSRTILLSALCGSGLSLIGCGGSPSERMPVQAQAFQIVQTYFSAVLPAAPSADSDDVKGELKEPDVRWWKIPCPGSDRTAVIVGGNCYSGLFYRGAGIDVAWRGSFGHSAYTHELMHYFLFRTRNDADPLHQEKEMWDAVQSADRTLQDLDL